MTTERIPYRYDIVGSFLRKPALKAARKAFEDGKITAAELKAQEDASIRELVADEKKAGLKAVTDGEYRRAFWHLDFLWNQLPEKRDDNVRTDKNKGEENAHT